MSARQPIRVLVIDDSAIARKFISDILRRDPEIEVVGTAGDPYLGRDKILELNPDVVTLDIEMPRMDGITFLRILRKQRPIPVVIVSSLSVAGSEAALDAMSAGAVDVLAKPSGRQSLADLEYQLPRRVKGAAGARRQIVRPLSAFAPPIVANNYDPRQVIVIGASTGGVEALTTVLSRLPAGLPGICVVQHIPPIFSRTFAERLNQTCRLQVREAAEGDEVRSGECLIAPGDFHLRLARHGARYRVALDKSPLRHFTRPSVDALFESAAECAGSQALGVLLTGMGRDGAEGMLALKQAGARTLAQDQRTCVVYGMPRAAVELGAVDLQAPLEQIPQAMTRELDRRGKFDAESPKRTSSASFLHSAVF